MYMYEYMDASLGILNAVYSFMSKVERESMVMMSYFVVFGSDNKYIYIYEYMYTCMYICTSIYPLYKPMSGVGVSQ